MKGPIVLRIAAVLVLALACTARPQPTPTQVTEPSPTFTSSPSASPSATKSPSPKPTERPESPSPCDGQDPKRGIAQPDTLTLVDRCKTSQGVVTAVDKGADGSIKLRLALDYGQASALNLKNMTDLNEELPVTVVCSDPVPQAAAATCGTFKVKINTPSVGSHVSVVGALVTDTTVGWNVIEPVWAITTIASPPPSVPASVAATKQLWSSIRQEWPAIPPAIILAQQSAGTAASSSLYPDGVAHVFVGDEVPEAHVVWHEAGHVLHAVAMRERGHSAALFTAADEVGVAYWSARGFPGTWAQTLTSGSWGSLGYEALAETFAAVNLGDSERTVTYAVPLDRSAMRTFFGGLVPTHL